jgi:acylphosphatase
MSNSRVTVTPGYTANVHVMNRKQARRWLISGRVQGVGFRFFVQHKADELGVSGWTRNLEDGRVEVYATGTPDQLDNLAAALHVGPRMADVRSIDQQEAPVEHSNGFHVR